MDIDHTRPHRRVQQFTLSRVLETYLNRLNRPVACLGALYHVYREAGVFDSLKEFSRVIYPHDAREPLPTVQDES